MSITAVRIVPSPSPSAANAPACIRSETFASTVAHRREPTRHAVRPEDERRGDAAAVGDPARRAQQRSGASAPRTSATSGTSVKVARRSPWPPASAPSATITSASASASSASSTSARLCTWPWRSRCRGGRRGLDGRGGSGRFASRREDQPSWHPEEWTLISRARASSSPVGRAALGARWLRRSRTPAHAWRSRAATGNARTPSPRNSARAPRASRSTSGRDLGRGGRR